jgi:predicted HicB family RNase H-like nuclease
MEYKGYFGSAEVDVEGNALVGKLLFMRDVITYSATTPKGLQKAFREAVDDYLETCKELGSEPDTPCKGTFNVRIGPELHRQVALIARSKGKGLNEFVRDALEAAILPSLVGEVRVPKEVGRNTGGVDGFHARGHDKARACFSGAGKVVKLP